MQIPTEKKHFWITQENIDTLVELLYSHPEFNQLARTYAIKQTRETLTYLGVALPATEEELFHYDIANDYYHDWFRSLVIGYLGKRAPYVIPVTLD